MNASFFLSSVMFLTSEQLPRLVANAGVSQAHIDRLRGPHIWAASDRTTMRQTIDAILFAGVDVASLPRTDVPAEMVAGVCAALVDPVNWPACASWLGNYKAARDLADPEQSVTLETVSSGRMLTLIIQAHSAFTDSAAFAPIAAKIQQRMTKAEVK